MNLWIDRDVCTPDPALTTPDVTQYLYALTLSTFQSGTESQWRDHPLCLQALQVAVFTLLAPLDIPGDRASSQVDIHAPSSTAFSAEQPEWVNGLVDFVFGQGSEGKMNRMYDRLSECRCSMEDPLIRYLHRPDRAHERVGIVPLQEPFQHFQTLSHSLFHFLKDLIMGLQDHNYKLDRLTQVPSSSSSKVREKNLGLVRLVHYFRDEPRTMLISCAFWYRRCTSVLVLQYLSNARRLQPHGVFDEHGGVLGPAIGHLVCRQLEHHAFLVLKQGKGECNVLVDAYLQDVMGMVGFVYGMASKNTGLNAQAEFFRPCGKKMYRSICKVMTTFDREASWSKAHKIIRTNALPLLARTATTIHRWISSEFTWEMMHMVYMRRADPRVLDRNLDKVVVKYNEWSELGLKENPTQGLWAFLQNLKARRECARVGCGKGPKTAKSDAFSRCIGCMLCSYCSRECQRLAWHDPKFPHKNFCKDWGLLADTWPKDRVELAAFIMDSTSCSASSDLVAPLNQDLETAALKEGLTKERLEELYDGQEEFAKMIMLRIIH